jgi:uncharacterized protein (TIGR03086 family)
MRSWNVPELHRRAAESFGHHVLGVGDDQWHLPTPCQDWNLHALVNHVTYEDLWTVELFEGRTIEEVGDRFDGDLLGDAPKRAVEEALHQAIEAVQAAGAMDRVVHLSFGDVPGREYAWQLFAEHLIHGWDVARATGSDERLDPELVEACTEWFTSMEEGYRRSGSVGDRPDIPAGSDAQTRLLAMFGRGT